MLKNFPAARWLPVILLVIFAGVASLKAQVPSPGRGSSVTPAQARQASQETRLWLPVFQFRNGFWVNLQHFLYLQARLSRGLRVAPNGGPSPAAWQTADVSALTPAERTAWQKAVGYYERNYADYDLAYDSSLTRVDERLSEISACTVLSGEVTSVCNPGLDPALTAALEQAAPIYRAHWWPEQQRANQAWIDQASELVRKYGGKPAELLANLFDNTWPADPIPIDVTLYAGTYGAYATLFPLHVNISSAAPQNQGILALEVVFRESSHAIAEPASEEIGSACQRATKPEPRGLWPALVFYTTTQVFIRAFPGKSTTGPSAPSAPAFMAAHNQYVAERGWQNYDALLGLYWQPFLDGRWDMRSAIQQLVNAL